MKKILSLLAGISLVTISGSTVIACGPPKHEIPKVEDLVQVRHFEFKTWFRASSSPSFIEEVKKQNKNFDGSVFAHIIDESNAIIAATPFSSLTGRVRVTYNVTDENTLKPLILNTDLGELENSSKENILSAVFEKNPNLKIPEISEFEVLNDYELVENTAAIYGRWLDPENNYFTVVGIVGVKFSVK